MKAKMKINSDLLLVLLFGVGIVVNAHADSGSTSLSMTQRNEVMQTLFRKLKENYVFAELGGRVTEQLSVKNREGAYNHASTASALSEVLSKDLRQMGNDKHFRVFYDPNFHEENTPDAVPTPQEMVKEGVKMARIGFGIENFQRLPGNVGYLEVRRFVPADFVSAPYTSAMTLLAGTDALILDLRRNGGGDAASVAALMSHFFAAGDERHLNDQYSRSKDMTQQFWTSRSVTERYSKPVYVLTSPRTFSAGEECAYDFQTQKRATLVGETTGGGANPGGLFSLGHGMGVFIPTGRSINPVTHTNWEHVGVKPDIAVPAAQAKQTAYIEILRTLVKSSTNHEEQANLQQTLSLAEKGESAAPVYEMNRK